MKGRLVPIEESCAAERPLIHQHGTGPALRDILSGLNSRQRA